MPTQPIQAADLFCGAGGTSSGLIRAASSLSRPLSLLAVNHWPTAIATHTLNHPGVRHLCESLSNIRPLDAVPGGRLDLLCASPECTHHSRARGGKPRCNQSRAGAWHIIDWCSQLRVENLLIENVPEFTQWGPLTRAGKPHKRKKGQHYRAWLQTLHSLGYQTTVRMINCADYGDPTTRRRFFLLASLNREPQFPAQTHPQNSWVPAREIIDWSLTGQSIFTRKKPLSSNTMRRIVAGLNKYSGLPFLVQWDQTGSGGDCVRLLDKPLATVITKQNTGLVQPFLVELRGTSSKQVESSARSTQRPLPALTSSGAHLALIESFILHTNHAGGDRVHSLANPIPTITGGHRGEMALASPVLVKYYGNETSGQSIEDPIDTITGRDRFALCQPIIEHDGHRYQLDVRFRMLQPGELAAGQGFPKGYKFSGNREDTVKQIGNAVPVNTATALCRAMLEN